MHLKSLSSDIKLYRHGNRNSKNREGAYEENNSLWSPALAILSYWCWV